MTILWGAAFTFIPLALESFAPLDLMVLRFGLAALCYAALLLTRVIRFTAINAADLPRFLAMTATLVVGYNILLNTAQLHVPASLAILVGQGAPMLVLLIERVTTGSFQVARPGIALATWAVGTALVLTSIRVAPYNGAWPLALLCLTPIAMATYMILARPLVGRYGADNVCAQMFLSGGGILVLALGWRPAFWAHVMSASTESLGAAAGLVGLTTVLGYTLWFNLLRQLGASGVATYLNLVPISGCALATLVLGESLSPQMILGGALVVVGCVATGQRLPRLVTVRAPMVTQTGLGSSGGGRHTPPLSGQCPKKQLRTARIVTSIFARLRRTGSDPE